MPKHARCGKRFFGSEQVKRVDRHALPPRPRGQRRVALPALRRRALDDAGRIPDGARGAHRRARATRPTQCSSVFRRNGLDEQRAAGMGGRGNRYADAGAGFSALVPAHHRRRRGRDRQAHAGAPSSATAMRPSTCRSIQTSLNAVIAGDMLLSTISTNVSVWSIDPEGDPLRLFLESIARYRELPAGRAGAAVARQAVPRRASAGASSSRSITRSASASWCSR